MKQLFRKTKGVVRGVPSAVLLSALFHFILLFIAGSFVVFSVIKKQEKKFVPPKPIERPKMELKKPRVKMHKTAAPRTTQRIAAKNIQQAMPNIQLPEISGIGSGLGKEIGGFEMMPDPDEISMFGGKTSTSVGNDFEGTFYSSIYDRRGQQQTQSMITWIKFVRKFLDYGWNPNVFASFYRAPRKLYATQFMIPPVASENGPEQFGVSVSKDEDFYAGYWAIHYKGRIASKKGGRFRFRGTSDNLLFVRVDGKLVLNAAYGGPNAGDPDFPPLNEDDLKNCKYRMGNTQMRCGNWFELEPGVPVNMEVLIAEYTGGFFAAMLVVEEEGVQYPVNQEGAPILPVFKTAEMPDRIRKQIEYTLIKGEADLEGGPLFNVY